jgi:hypothetical protein
MVVHSDASKSFAREHTVRDGRSRVPDAYLAALAVDLVCGGHLARTARVPAPGQPGAGTPRTNQRAVSTSVIT